MNKAIFLYNDGTLLPDYFSDKHNKKDQNNNELLFRLKELQQYGYIIIQLLSHNQFTEQIDKGIRILEFGAHNSTNKLSLIIKEFYYQQSEAFHFHPTIHILQNASEGLELDMSKSWFIGSSLDCIEAANNLDFLTIFVDTGKEFEWMFGPNRTPNYISKSIDSAINEIKTHSIELA